MLSAADVTKLFQAGSGGGTVASSAVNTTRWTRDPRGPSAHGYCSGGMKVGYDCPISENNHVELRQLEQFVAVAEERHFARAAARCEVGRR